MAESWQATLVLGVLTLILGVVVSFHPTGSLNFVAVMIGILMILSGIFHLVRVFGPDESHRVWLGLAGLLFIVIGVVLIRHLHLTVALIGLFVGLTWVVQGGDPQRAAATLPHADRGHRVGDQMAVRGDHRLGRHGAVHHQFRGQLRHGSGHVWRLFGIGRIRISCRS